MEKHGLAKFGQMIGNISARKISDYKYNRQELANWELSPNDKWIINNVNIVDVDNGTIHEEKTLLIDGTKFGKRLNKQDVEDLSKKPEIGKVIDGGGQYLLPGLSDLHCHLTLISEYGMKMPSLYYFDAQRMKNCEYALSKGCTTVRDGGGAYDMVHGLKEEIENGSLLGPRIFPSYITLTPKGGMWDINLFLNKMMEMFFGGKVMDFCKNDEQIKRHIDKVVKLGAYSIKTYLEEKPLYGGNEDTTFNMLTDEQMKYIRNLADEYGKILESHAMFILGARKAIQARVNSIAHMTVDESYSLEDAEMMVKNNVAIIPTFDVGSFLAMNCGSKGFPDHPEYRYFRDMLDKYINTFLGNGTLPQLRPAYYSLYEFITSEIADRKMPGIGPVHPERLHGFGVYAPESLNNFRKAGTKVGLGTDGGLGTSFSGAFEIEFESYLRYGFSPKEIVRLATLGNMEILKQADQLGSIAEGKLADMILIKDNPFDNVLSMTQPTKVFKEGRCYIDSHVN